ncbi:DUF485 domain-containing protein [Desertihabitans aurantiacus]|uniref:DUF485 domain-containing protein n=1 Tax=Desertihabitans aurantiacus TaxID=2282477 RepID=UPI000DF8528E|nr:DUF485 domain-containing protein [Desertihabitans aurantiacus]
MDTPHPQVHQRYEAVAARPEFDELRRRYLRFVVPATITFMAWYVVYVACNNWARGFMNQQVVGHVNVAVVFGLLQFVSTFAIAVLYARYSIRRLDPLADELREDFESGSARGVPGAEGRGR